MGIAKDPLFLSMLQALPRRVAGTQLTLADPPQRLCAAAAVQPWLMLGSGWLLLRDVVNQHPGPPHRGGGGVTQSGG